MVVIVKPQETKNYPFPLSTWCLVEVTVVVLKRKNIQNTLTEARYGGGVCFFFSVAYLLST